MSFKNTFWIIFLTLFAFNLGLAEETIFNYSPDSVYSNKGRLSHNVGKIDSKSVFEKAKKVCKELGFNTQSEKFVKCGLELAETASGFDLARNQEYLLSKKIQKKENINMSFAYEPKSGKKMNEESKWTKFWKEAAWVLYEHGDDILKVVLDLKYDTNFSGYNSNNEVTNNRSGLRCTGQRIGKVIHETCRGGGVTLRCTTQILGKMAKRTCREV
jgi:hypothetical protein